jgi:E3 ubiquitin-protein ligase HERC3
MGDDAGEMGDNLPVVNLGSGLSATKLALGEHHSCAILNNGALKCWGYANLGAIGSGGSANLGDSLAEMGDSLAAVALGTGRTALQIASGYESTCVVLDNYSVKCWGLNSDGQLGLGDRLRHQ